MSLRGSRNDRSNPVTMHREHSYGIASSPSHSLRSFGLLAMTMNFEIKFISSLKPFLYPPRSQLSLNLF